MDLVAFMKDIVQIVLMAIVSIPLYGYAEGAEIAFYCFPFMQPRFFSKGSTGESWRFYYTGLLAFMPMSTWAVCFVSAGVYWTAERAEIKVSSGGAALDDEDAPIGLCQEVLAHLSQLIFVYVQDRKTGRGRMTYVSSRCEAIFGVSNDVATSSDFDLYFRVHPEDRERYLADTLRAAAEQSNMHLELRLLAGDGKYHWTRIRSKVKKIKGNQTLWFGMCDEISDIVESRSQLFEENTVIQTLESVLAVTFDVTVYVDSDMRILKDSAKLRHFFARPKESLEKVDFASLLSSDSDRIRLSLYFEQIIAHGQPPSFISINIKVGKTYTLKAELYGSVLPWPLEGERLIGLRVDDSTAAELITLETLAPDAFVKTKENEQQDDVESFYSDDTFRLIRIEISGNIFEISSKLAAGLEEPSQDAFFRFSSEGNIREALYYLEFHTNGNLNVLKPETVDVSASDLAIVFKFVAISAVDICKDPSEAIQCLKDANLSLQLIVDAKIAHDAALFIFLAGSQVAIAHPELLENDIKIWLNGLFTTASSRCKDDIFWRALVFIQWASFKFSDRDYDQADYFLEKAIETFQNDKKSFQMKAVALHNLSIVKEAREDISGVQSVIDKLKLVIKENRKIRFHESCIDLVGHSL